MSNKIYRYIDLFTFYITLIIRYNFIQIQKMIPKKYTTDLKDSSLVEQEETILKSIGLTKEATDTLALTLIEKLIQRTERQWSTTILDDEFIICMVALHGILDNYRTIAWGNVDDILKVLTDRVHMSQLSRPYRHHVLSYISSSGRVALSHAYIEKYWRYQQSASMGISKKHTTQQQSFLSWSLDLIRLQAQCIVQARDFFQNETLENLQWNICQRAKELISEKKP